MNLTTGSKPARKTFTRVPQWLRPGNIMVGLVAGLVGGLLGVFLVNDYFSLGISRSQQVVLEESSAIIEVAERVGPSVVSVVTESKQMDVLGQGHTVQTGAGSGIIISDDGLILTNKHVVNGSSSIKITTSDRRTFDKVKVLARDPLNDLAYLKVEADGLQPATLGDSDQVVAGQRVIAIGNALGEFSNTITSGIISGLGRPVSASDGLSRAELLEDLIQTDAAINPGNSGGPLVDIEGRVIGINTAVAGGAENIGFAIPINQAKSGIQNIRDTGKLNKPFLGVRFISLTPEIAEQNDLGVGDGAWVVSNSRPAVIPNSPAAKAGVEEGDVITAINGEDINQDRSLSTLIGRYKAGDEVTLTITRDDKQIEIKVILASLPES